MSASEQSFLTRYASDANNLQSAEFFDEHYEGIRDIIEALTPLKSTSDSTWREALTAVSGDVRSIQRTLGDQARRRNDLFTPEALKYITPLLNELHLSDVKWATQWNASAGKSGQWYHLSNPLGKVYEFQASVIDDIANRAPTITTLQFAKIALWSILCSYTYLTYDTCEKLGVLLGKGSGEKRTFHNQFIRTLSQIDEEERELADRWNAAHEKYLASLKSESDSDENAQHTDSNNSDNEQIQHPAQPEDGVSEVKHDEMHIEVPAQPQITSAKAFIDDITNANHPDTTHNTHIDSDDDSNSSNTDDEQMDLGGFDKLTFNDQNAIPHEIDNQLLMQHSLSSFEFDEKHEEEEGLNERAHEPPPQNEPVIDDELMQSINDERITGLIGDLYIDEPREMPSRTFEDIDKNTYDDAVSKCLKRLNDQNAIAKIMYVYDSYGTKSITSADFKRVAHDITDIFCKALGFKTQDILSSQLSLPSTYVQKFKADFKDIYNGNPLCKALVNKICGATYADFNPSDEDCFFNDQSKAPPIGNCGTLKKAQYDELDSIDKKQLYKNQIFRQNIRATEFQNWNRDLLNTICQKLMHTFYKTYKTLNIAGHDDTFNIFSISQTLQEQPHAALRDIVKAILAGQANLTKAQVKKLSHSTYKPSKLKFQSGMSDGVVPSNVPYLHKLAFRYQHLQDRIDTSQRMNRKSSIAKADDLRLLQKPDDEIDPNKNIHSIPDAFNSVKQGKLKLT